MMLKFLLLIPVDALQPSNDRHLIPDPPVLDRISEENSASNEDDRLSERSIDADALPPASSVNAQLTPARSGDAPPKRIDDALQTANPDDAHPSNMDHALQPANPVTAQPKGVHDSSSPANSDGAQRSKIDGSSQPANPVTAQSRGIDGSPPPATTGLRSRLFGSTIPEGFYANIQSWDSDDLAFASSFSDDEEAHSEDGVSNEPSQIKYERPGRSVRAKFTFTPWLHEGWLESMNPSVDVAKRLQARDRAKDALVAMVKSRMSGRYSYDQILEITGSVYDIVAGIYSMNQLLDKADALFDSMFKQGYSPQAHRSGLDDLSAQLAEEFKAENISERENAQIKFDIKKQRKYVRFLADLAKMLGTTTLTPEQSQTALRTVFKFTEKEIKAPRRH